MACSRVHTERSAWSTEGLITKGFEIRPAGVGRNRGPLGSAKQDLVTRGWSYPHTDFDGGLNVLDFYGLERMMSERLTRLFDGLRGLSDPTLPAFVSDLAGLSWIGDYSGEPRKVAQIKALFDLQKKVYGAGPHIFGLVPETFDLPGTPVLKAKFKATIEGVVGPEITVELNDGLDGAEDLSAFYVSQFFNNNVPFTDAGMVAYVTAGKRVSVKLSVPAEGPDSTIELMAVADSAYSLLGWTIGVYSGNDPIADFSELCDSIMPDILPILIVHEDVRTGEIA